MTTDYLRGLEDAAKWVRENCNGRYDQGSGAEIADDMIRSLAPAQGVDSGARDTADTATRATPDAAPGAPMGGTSKCPDCGIRGDGSVHTAACGIAWKRISAPPLVHVDDGQGFRRDEEPCEHRYDPLCRDPEDRCIRCGKKPAGKAKGAP